jgi:polysaccharide biosynthesis/export protein
MLLGQAPPPTPATRPVQPPRPPDTDEYKIGTEDVLAIFVWQNADLTRTVPVRPDGRISLPLINEVQASGLTPLQLRDALVERYRQFDKAIELSVMIQEVSSFRVSVIGKVAHPQRYNLKSPTTILELLAMAGGLLEYADGENITLLRPEPMAPGRSGTGKMFRRMRFNYKRVVSSGGETENFPVLPNDIVIIP